MAYTPSPAETEMIHALSQRTFAYKVVSVRPDGLKDALQTGPNTSRSHGWVHIGHIRNIQKSEPIVNVFYARLMPRESVARTIRFFHFQHLVTLRLPNQKLYAANPDWLPLLTKRWSAFDKDIPTDYCVTFLAKPKRTAAAVRKDVIL